MMTQGTTPTQVKGTASQGGEGIELEPLQPLLRDFEDWLRLWEELVIDRDKILSQNTINQLAIVKHR